MHGTVRGIVFGVTSAAAAFVACFAIVAFVRSIDWGKLVGGAGKGGQLAASVEHGGGGGGHAAGGNWLRRNRTLLGALAFVVFTRVLLYIFAYLFASVFRGEEKGILESLEFLWQRSDAPHYMDIATEGYVNEGDHASFLVFLPLFPLLTRIAWFIVGDFFAAGVLVSLVTFTISCAVVFKIAIRLGGSERIAFSAVCLMALFPASFFVNGTFSEGLFLLTTSLSLYFMLGRAWVPAGAAGLLAAFTRYYGILLVVPFLIEYAQSCAGVPDSAAQSRAEPGRALKAGAPSRAAPSRAEPDSAAPSRALKAGVPDGAFSDSAPARDASAMPSFWRRLSNVAGFAAGAWPILLVPCGFVAYLCVNWAVAGDPFRFLAIQREHWHQSFGFFADNIAEMAVNALTWDRVSSLTLFVPQLALIAIAFALLAYGALSRFRLSLQAYLAVYVLVSVSATWMLSFPRYLFGAAPVFLLAAKAGGRSRVINACVIAACAFGQIYLMTSYVTGHYVY